MVAHITSPHIPLASTSHLTLGCKGGEESSVYSGQASVHLKTGHNIERREQWILMDNKHLLLYRVNGISQVHNKIIHKSQIIEVTWIKSILYHGFFQVCLYTTSHLDPYLLLFSLWTVQDTSLQIFVSISPNPLMAPRVCDNLHLQTLIQFALQFFYSLIPVELIAQTRVLQTSLCLLDQIQPTTYFCK